MKKLLIFSILALVLLLAAACTKEAPSATGNPAKQAQPDSPAAEQNTAVADDDTGVDQGSDSVPGSEDTGVAETAEEGDDTQEQASSEELADDDTSDDCNLLSADDIKDVCGADTVKDVKEPNTGIGQVCETLFATSDPLKGIKITYTGGYNPEAVETLMDNCINSRNGEEITEYACYTEDAGKTATIHGKEWKIFVSNYMPMEDYFICSAEQLKELGKLVSDRIYVG